MIRLICITGIFFVLLNISCSDSETPPPTPVAGSLSMHKMWEDFNADGTIQLVGRVGFGSRDTIQSVGFVYTDDPISGNEGIREPDLESDHLAVVTELTPHPEDPDHLYTFESSINPSRTGEPNDPDDAVVNIAVFIKTTAGKAYKSSAWTFKGSKLLAISTYPAYTTPGEDVVIELNRDIENGEIKAVASGMAPQSSYPIKIFVGDQEVEIASTGSHPNTGRPTVIFRMPEGVTEETTVTVKASEYATASDVKIKNASRSFELITEKDRDFSGSPILFASPDAIYFGGGDNPGSTQEPVPDFWKYTISTNIWTPKKNYPEDGASGLGMALYANNKAWYGQPTHFNRYDLVADTWTPLSEEPAGNIQYDHTFSKAQSVMYDGKFYFTHFSAEFTIGPYYLYNFWTFDPETEEYDHLNGYPGDAYDAEESLTQAVVYDGKLHFFPGFQHWVYDPVGGNWTHLADIGPKRNNSSEFYAFSFKNELYGVSRIHEVIDGRSKGTARLLKYNAADDTWLRDADMPAVGPVYVLTVDQDNVFLAIKGATMAFFRIE